MQAWKRDLRKLSEKYNMIEKLGWDTLKQLLVIIVGCAEENSASVCWDGQKGEAGEEKNAQIGTKWTSNEYSVIWLGQRKPQSRTSLIFFTLV